MLTVSNLVKLYGNEKALDNLSFTGKSGEIIGLIGPNGAGKSTAMNIITGYLAPTSGEVEINGFNIQSNSMEARKSTGFLPETPPLYTKMTVYEYLNFAAELKGIKKRQKQVCQISYRKIVFGRSTKQTYRNTLKRLQAKNRNGTGNYKQSQAFNP